MAGESSQEKGAKRAIGDFRNLSQLIGEQDFTVGNRFDNYKPEFSANQMFQNVDKNTLNMGNMLNQAATNAVGKAQGDTSARLASQGITGGSLLNDRVSNAGEGIRGNQFNALQNLGLGANRSKLGIMDSANRGNLMATRLGQNADFQNMSNNMNQFNMRNSALGGQNSMVGMLDNTTWLDDVFSGLNTAANIGSAVAGF